MQSSKEFSSAFSSSPSSNKDQDDFISKLKENQAKFENAIKQENYSALIETIACAVSMEKQRKKYKEEDLLFKEKTIGLLESKEMLKLMDAELLKRQQSVEEKPPRAIRLWEIKNTDHINQKDESDNKSEFLKKLNNLLKPADLSTKQFPQTIERESQNQAEFMDDNIVKATINEQTTKEDLENKLEKETIDQTSSSNPTTTAEAQSNMKISTTLPENKYSYSEALVDAANDELEHDEQPFVVVINQFDKVDDNEQERNSSNKEGSSVSSNTINPATIISDMKSIDITKSQADDSLLESNLLHHNEDARNKSNKWFTIINQRAAGLIILIIVAVIGVGLYLYLKPQKPTISPTTAPTTAPTFVEPDVVIYKDLQIVIQPEVTSMRCLKYTNSTECFKNKCHWDGDNGKCIIPSCKELLNSNPNATEIVCKESGCNYIQQFSTATKQWTSKCVEPSTTLNNTLEDALSLESNLTQKAPSGNCINLKSEISCIEYPGCFWKNGGCYNAVFYKSYEFEAADFCSNWPNLRVNCVAKNLLPLPQTRVGFDKASGSWSFIDKSKILIYEDKRSFRAEIQFAHDPIPGRSYVYHVHLNNDGEENRVDSISKLEIIPFKDEIKYRCRIDTSFENMYPNATYNKNESIYEPSGNPGFFVTELLTRPWMLIPELRQNDTISNSTQYNDTNTNATLIHDEPKWIIPMRRGYVTASVNKEGSNSYRKSLGLDQHFDISSGPVTSDNMLLTVSKYKMGGDISVPYFVIQKFHATVVMYQFLPSERIEFEHPSYTSCMTESNADDILIPEINIRGDMSLDLEEGMRNAKNESYTKENINNTCFSDCFDMKNANDSVRQQCVDDCVESSSHKRRLQIQDIDELFDEYLEDAGGFLNDERKERILATDADGFWSLDNSKESVYQSAATNFWNKDLGNRVRTCLSKHRINTCEGQNILPQHQQFKDAFGILVGDFKGFGDVLKLVEEAFMYIYNVFVAANVVYDVTQALNKDLTTLIDVLRIVATIPFLTGFVSPVITVLNTIRDIIVTVGDNMRDVHQSANQYKDQVKNVLDTSYQARNSVSYLQVTINTFFLQTIDTAKCYTGLSSPLSKAVGPVKELASAINGLSSGPVKLIKEFANLIIGVLRFLKVDFLKLVARKVLEIKDAWDRSIGKIVAPINAALDKKIVISVFGPFCTGQVRTCLDVPTGVKYCKKYGVEYPCGLEMKTECTIFDVPTFCNKEFGFTVRQLLRGISSVLSIFQDGIESAAKALFSSINFNIIKVLPIDLNAIKGLPNAASLLAQNRESIKGEAIKLLGKTFPPQILEIYNAGLAPNAESTIGTSQAGIWMAEPFKSLLVESDLHKDCVGLPPTNSPTIPTRSPVTPTRSPTIPTRPPAPRTLSFFHSGCNSSSKSRHPDCISAMHRYCNFFYGLGVGISQEAVGNVIGVACIPGRIEISSYSSFPNCNGNSASIGCYAQTHLWCFNKGLGTYGFPQEVTSSDAAIGCYTGNYIEIKWSDLGFCSGNSLDSQICVSYFHRYCQGRGYGNVGMAFQQSQTAVGVGCAQASVLEDVAVN